MQSDDLGKGLFEQNTKVSDKFRLKQREKCIAEFKLCVLTCKLSHDFKT